ncbi:MAG: tetratricopeptide repeat protein [Vulcanimicrobiaceae bacterium]
MFSRCRTALRCVVAFAAVACADPARAQSARPDVAREPLRVAVDASDAPQKIYHVRTTIPVRSGPFAFVYPKWIPGYHGPVGPIEALVNLRVSAGGTPLPWRRDLVDPYAFETEVPAGATSLDVAYDIVGATSHNGQNDVVSTSQLAILEYSNFVVYPRGATAVETPVAASLTLPRGWTFGTALPVRGRSGDTIAFAPASLYTLVDSPVIAGAHERSFDLGSGHVLDVAADGAAALELTPKFLVGMKHLVAEGPALYGGRHFRDYHFLLAMSDAIAPNGIEHHESSDNRTSERYAMDDATYRSFVDLLPHEYSHSWNGKYRRPSDLAVADYQEPEKTDLLWVYEGMNQYNGEKLSTRARLNSFADELDFLAISAASMDVESGRSTRPIRDTADAAAMLYQAPSAYKALRRSAGDFYTEGDLIWLDADVTIRRLTHGARSLDDFERLFAGGTTTSVPALEPYTEAQLYALLGRVVPYDWPGFFRDRIATATARAPLGGIVGGGYRLAYADKPSDLFKAIETERKIVDATYSLGIVFGNDGESLGKVDDILTGSDAFAAGVAPGMRALAVDGRKFSADALHDALRAHRGSSVPLRLIVANEDYVKVVDVVASTGERYPHLVRDPSRPDLLAGIYAPKTFVPSADRAERHETR